MRVVSFLLTRTRMNALHNTFRQHREREREDERVIYHIQVKGRQKNTSYFLFCMSYKFCVKGGQRLEMGGEITYRQYALQWD